MAYKRTMPECFRLVRMKYCTARTAPLTLKYKYPSSFPKAFYRVKEYKESLISLENTGVPLWKRYERLTDSMGYVGDDQLFFDSLRAAVKNNAYERIFHYMDTAKKEGIRPLPFEVMKAFEELFAELATSDVQPTTLPHATKIVLPVWMSVMRLQLGKEFLEDKKSKDTSLPQGQPPLAFSLEAPTLPLLWFYDDGVEPSHGNYATSRPALRNIPDPSMLYRLSVSALSAACSLGDWEGISLITTTIFHSKADCSSFGVGAKLAVQDISPIWDDVLTFIAEGLRRCSSTHFARFVVSADKPADSSSILNFPPLFSEGDSLEDVNVRGRLEKSVQYFPNATITFLEGLNAHKGTVPRSLDFHTMLKLTVAQVVEKKVCADVSEDCLYLLRDLVCEHSAVQSKFLNTLEPLLEFLQRRRADVNSLFETFEKASIDRSLRIFTLDKSLWSREDTLDRPLSWVIERTLLTHGDERLFHLLSNIQDKDLSALPFLLQDPSLFPLTWETVLRAIILAGEKHAKTHVHVLTGYMSRLSERGCVQRVMDDGFLAGATFDALVKLKLVTQAVAFLESTVQTSNLHISASSFQALYRTARDEGMSTLCATLQPKRTLIIP